MKKTMMPAVKLVVGAYLLLGFFYALAIGYYTHTTASKLVDSSHWDEIRSIENVRETNDQLFICVRGTLAGNVFGSRFQIAFPLAAIRGRSSSSRRDDVELKSSSSLSGLDTYIVSRSLVDEACTDGGGAYTPDQIEIPAVNVMESFDESNSMLEPARVYQASVYWRDARDERTYTKQKEILYAYRNGEGDTVIASIETAPLDGNGSPAWAAVLPFAVAADALTFPVQILLWIDYGSAH